MNIRDVFAGHEPADVIKELGIAVTDETAALYASAISAGCVTLTDAMTCRDILCLIKMGVDCPAPVHALLMLLFAVRNKGSLCLPLQYEILRAEIAEVFCDHPDVAGFTDAIFGLASTGTGFKGPVIQNGERLYFDRYFSHESSLKSHFAGLVQAGSVPLFDSTATLRNIVERSSCAGVGDNRRDLNDEQKLALVMALRNRLVVVSGGPGTGKTRLLASLLRAFLHAGLDREDILLIAPTGRAGKRMGESVAQALKEAVGFEDPAVLAKLAGITGSTIHSALGSNPHRQSFTFRRSNRLPYRAVVCDEVSMVDVILMDALLDAVAVDCRVVFMGDRHQLPSVEAGAVLGELVPSVQSPEYTREVIDLIGDVCIQPAGIREGDGPMADRIVTLAKSYRSKGDVLARAALVNSGDGAAFARIPWIGAVQIDRSSDNLDWGDRLAVCRGIEPVSSDIDGMMPVLESWLSWLYGAVAGGADDSNARSPAAAITEIAAFEVDTELTEVKKVWLRRLFAAVRRGQILCAIREGAQGVAGINAAVARILDPAGPDRSAYPEGQRASYFPGCPIMVTRNDRSLDLYNGDTGIVLNGHHGLVAVFEEGGDFRSIPTGELRESVPAFAITVHKSQGSEYDNVLIVLPARPDHPLMTREILYTGMTRARSNVWFFARRACLDAAVVRHASRYSGLDLWPRD